jgi:exodeoxyribonuclease VII large subunit
MPIPVWVGIGHTGDQSVADIVANKSFVTPTECGQELVGRVASWWDTISGRTAVVSRRAVEILDLATRNDELRRHRLARCAMQQLKHHSGHLTARGDRVARLAPRQVEASAAHLSSRADRISSLSLLALDRQAERAEASRRLLVAYDVERQLERGYTLTLDSQGRLVRSVANLEAGDTLSTRFADGTAQSSVQLIEPQQSATQPEQPVDKAGEAPGEGT